MARLRMKCFALDEVPFHRQVGRRALPFELRRESRTRPIRVGVGFEITDVCDRLVFIDGAQTRQGKVPPSTVAFHPVERRRPTLFIHSDPA